MSEDRGWGCVYVPNNPPMYPCRVDEILRLLQTFIPKDHQGGVVYARARCGMNGNEGTKRGE